MKVRFKKKYLNKKKGGVHDLTNFIAKQLIAKGIVEQVSISEKKSVRKIKK